MRKLVAVLLLIVMLISSLCVNAEEVVWICNKCGAENTRYFCTRCGTKRHDDEIICKGCGEIYPADTEDIYCGNCGTKLKTNEYFSKYEGKGFETPEDAALCYLCGLKNLNLQQMLSAFAWETQVDHYDFKAMLTRLGSYTSAIVPGMPTANYLLRSANIEQIRYSQIEMICRALELFINDELYSMPMSSLLFNEGENDIEDYLLRCDNGKIEYLREMGNFRFYDVDEVTAGKFSSDIMQKNFLAQNARFGADETRVLFLAVDVGEEKYAIAPTLARYGEKWYIVDLSSIITAYWGIENKKTAFFALPDELKEELKENTSLSLSLDSLIHDDKRQYEREGFNSPEEAVEYYIDGLKNGNVQQMMEAFAWETQADRYSLVDYSRWYGSISYNSPIRMQVDNAFVKELNIETLRNQQSKWIYVAIRNYYWKMKCNSNSWQKRRCFC